MPTVQELLKARLEKHRESTAVRETVPEQSGTIDSSGGTGSRAVSDPISEVVEMAVATDLQPTALIVVERPEPAVDGKFQLVDDDAVTPSELDVSNPVHAGFLQRLHDLEVALLERDPMMKTHLGAIHKTMIEHEEITNLLSIEEISKIMAAQQQHTNIILVRDVAKASKTAANKRAAQIQLDDI